MTDKQIIKLNEITEMSQELGLYEDRPDWRITLQADHIKRLEEELQAKEQECKEWKDLANHNGRVCNERLDKIDELEHDINELNGQLDQLKAENKILKEKFEIAIKNNMDKTLLRLEKGDVQEELQEIREQFGIETLYCHDDNTRVHRCLDVLKLKDTLTEIKEIANKTLWTYPNLDDVTKYNMFDKILQKISECEE